MATRTSAAEMVSYEDLYARWEQGNWKTSELDFGQDREDWREKFSDLERRAARNQSDSLHRRGAA